VSSSPIRLVLSRIGERWTMLACYHIFMGVSRFSDLRAALCGISPKVLSETLARLERDGIVERQVVDDRPPKVIYELTPLGESLLGAVRTIADWAAAHGPLIEEAQRAYDARESLRTASR
jgi:DNA-binding HxlR family transcriptional regulator